MVNPGFTRTTLICGGFTVLAWVGGGVNCAAAQAATQRAAQVELARTEAEARVALTAAAAPQAKEPAAFRKATQGLGRATLGP